MRTAISAGGTPAPTIRTITRRLLHHHNRALRVTGGRAVFDIVPSALRPPSRQSQCQRGQSPSPALESWSEAPRQAAARLVSTVITALVSHHDRAVQVTLATTPSGGGGQKAGVETRPDAMFGAEERRPLIVARAPRPRDGGPEWYAVSVADGSKETRDLTTPPPHIPNAHRYTGAR